MPRRKATPYQHKESSALLRPEAGAQQSFRTAKEPRQYQYDSSLSPTLDWTGKAERADFEVPTLPLFIHERLSTQAILDTLHRRKRDRTQTLNLFGESDKSIGDKIRGAYEHLNGWQNRLILGDSLQVMNSLLQYENMGGKVQMVYMDPPYGIKFGGNFQPYVRRRDVKDGDDDSMSREPEMVQAYRDTWELGIHSWLTYMRDRLLLAREMLTDSGSCFVQISDENVHLVRNIMDEVFGRENFVSLIAYTTTSGFTSSTLSRAGDYICWYARDKTKMKYNLLFTKKGSPFNDPKTKYDQVELPDGSRRALTAEEKNQVDELPKDAKVYSLGGIDSQGSAGVATSFEFEGKIYNPATNRHWTANYPKGMENLRKANRIGIQGNKLRYIRYFSDAIVQGINNLWHDIGGSVQSRSDPKIYVVQTGGAPIQRCMLMTTDPGDLVFDPTCGSGTTAYVAEQWGRRWITADVSRVPLSLARQRLLTATYPYYQLKGESPGSGFVYQRKQNKKGEEVGGIVPHITLKSIANNEPPDEEVLVDKPEKDGGTIRISGPFCVEAILPTPLPLTDDSAAPAPADDGAANHIPRMIEILRLSSQIRLPQNKTLTLNQVRQPAKSLNLHAEAMADNKTVAIVFGPANGAISERVVVDAAKEAHNKDYTLLLVVAFAIEPPARKTVEESEETLRIPALYVQASTDLAMADLLKNMRSSEVFAVCGQPDVRFYQSETKHDDGEILYQVNLRGLDVFDPATMETEARKGDDVPCWMLDTDYDGQCFRAGQVFFPRTGAWENIKRSLRSEFDDSVWEHLSGDTSEPFVMGENKQIAVKVIDDRGNELMVVKKQEEAG